MNAKCLSIVLLLMMLRGVTFANFETDVYFTIYIGDLRMIVENQETGIQFLPSDPAIQDILENYEIYKVERTYPASRFEYMHKFFTFSVDSAQLLYDLLAYSNELFPIGHSEKSEPTYTPNDYGGPVVFVGDGQPELDYINAREAWDITTGSPNVTIGVTDLYFDITHPELSSQIINIRQNTPSSTPQGTAVAGIVAGSTDNNIGISAIGFNCKLDVSNRWGAFGHTEMLNMAKDGIKILNASWYHGSDLAGDYGVDNVVFGQQGIYNEVYENGAIPFFGAANYANQADGRDGYAYPASLDHCMSITSVGSRYNIGTLTYDAVADAENHPPGGMGGA